MQIRRETIVRAVFETDVAALKPGNVSRYAEGHGMRVDDFLDSARQVTPILCDPRLSLGQRIERSVEATLATVGCNTNLGMVLLFAPLLEAARPPPADLETLRERLATVLAEADGETAEGVFRAIARAAPGGLGSSDRYDVRRTPGRDLLAAMHYARHRDRIALQYVTNFYDIFSFGAPLLRRCWQRWKSVEWALSACYVSLLSEFADSHVERKSGKERATWLMGRAREVRASLLASDNPRDCIQALLALDRELKEAGVNPGTAADLSVASLLVLSLAGENTNGDRLVS